MCLFCDKLNEKESHVFNGKFFYSIFDEFPVSKGHMLIIPNRHINYIDDLTTAEIIELHTMIQDVKNYLYDYYDAEGFNIGINEGKVAGQTINHLHIHIIPRYEGDVENPRGGVRGVIPNKQKY